MIQVKIGDKIRIIKMKGESNYNGKIGFVEHIDDAGQIHGSWGGLAIIPKKDEFEIMDKKERHKVFVLTFDWSTDDAQDYEIYLFYRYEDAYRKFKEIIKDEMNPELSWVGEEGFDENGEVANGYVLDHNDGHKTDYLYWRFFQEGYYDKHSFLELFTKEIM